MNMKIQIEYEKREDIINTIDPDSIQCDSCHRFKQPRDMGPSIFDGKICRVCQCLKVNVLYRNIIDGNKKKVENMR